jgi:biopolymer transport protein ExbD
LKKPSILTGQRRLDVKMTPMIDVVFLLLVFFVWTASFQVAEYILPSALSVNEGSGEASEIPPEQLDFEPVVVQILWKNQQPAWIVSETAFTDLEQVRQTLFRVAAVKHDLPLVIDPQAGVPFGDVIDVYDISQIAGFQKIQFAIEEI